MTSSNTKQPTAFVIMPFDDEFDAVFKQLIVPTFNDIGYAVSRADTQLGMANILKTIVRSIHDSHLIVADLTIPNANVYYELGLAHALGKPTILLTENMDALPFDLRPYRVIQYSTHIAHIDAARDQLRRTAEGALDGTIEFSSPIADFLDLSVPSSVPLSAREEDEPGTDESSTIATEDGEADADEDEPGFLQHMIAFTDGMEEIKDVMETFTERTESASGSLSTGAEKLEAIQNQSDSEGGGAREQLVVSMAMGQDMNSYSRSLSELNDRYSNSIDQVQPALEGILTYQRPTKPEEHEALSEMIAVIDNSRRSMQELRDTNENTISILSDTPNFEKSFNRARKNVMVQLRRVTDNTDRMISMLSRAQTIAQERLET